MVHSNEYVTIVEPVLEVTLFGKADFGYWQAALKNEGISPMNCDGTAEILISAVDSKYMGVSFQELSVSIRTGTDTYFLAHAYNSIRLFALAERAFFQTPYYQGDIRLEKEKVFLQVSQQRIFEAQLNPQAPCLRSGEEIWELQIFLPKKLRKQTHLPHFFSAKLEGYTENYAAKLDSFVITPNNPEAIFTQLHDSQFQAAEWRLRASAKHSKSQTYHTNEMS